MKRRMKVLRGLKFLSSIFIISFISLTLVFGENIHPAFAQDSTPPGGDAEESLERRDRSGSSQMDSAPPEQLPTDRVIVKYFDSSEPTSGDEGLDERRVAALSDRAGMPIRYIRTMIDGAYVMRLPENMPLDQVQAIADDLMQLPNVEYAEPDARRWHTLVPNDPQYGSQWQYFDTYGINLPAAWDITTGTSNIVVAVVDTGITSHSEFTGRVVQGYDFIDDALTANDGNGRDSDPSDPGDWITFAESQSGWFKDCYVENSSWHGTHVAGIIGANTNNSVGVAGVNWNAKILPVRVLGKCGGYTSDIADGIRWAAGAAVAGTPANANPAKVINLSLGGYGSCSATEQSAIDTAIAYGATVVVAAGNENMDASLSSPGNCNNVITVGATADDGWGTVYSNYGEVVDISAPGGDSYFGNTILSTYNTGTTVPAAESYQYLEGTSMAAPHVSGVISLMLATMPSLTQTQILEILQNTAKGFNPSDSWCNTGYCGAGIVDAAAALNAAKFYGWAGGVSISSTQPLVTVARPHVGAEIASYNGFTAGSTTSFVPMLFRDAFGGSYDSALYIQNIHTTNTANVAIKYYDSNGNLNCTRNDTVSPLASKGYWLPSVTCTTGSLPSGWVGGVVVTSDQPIVAVGRPHIGDEVMTYDGVSSGSLESFVPMLFNGSFGGTYNSAFYVQNVHVSNTAHITISYYDSSGTLNCTKTDSVLPYASKGYWVPSTTCDSGSLPAGWVGGIRVTSDQPIVTVGRPHIDGQVTTYNGFTGGTISSYLTMLFKNAFGGSYNSAFYIQNTNSSNAANVTIYFYDNAGNLSCTKYDTIDGYASKGYWVPSVTCDVGGPLPTGWAGGVIVESSQPIVAVGRPHIGDQITTYDGFGAGGLTSYLPMLFKGAFGGSYDSAVYLQNLSGSSTASVTLNFYNSNGELSCTRTESVSALSIKGLWLPGLTCDP